MATRLQSRMQTHEITNWRQQKNSLYYFANLRDRLDSSLVLYCILKSKCGNWRKSLPGLKVGAA